MVPLSDELNTNIIKKQFNFKTEDLNCHSKLSDMNRISNFGHQESRYFHPVFPVAPEEGRTVYSQACPLSLTHLTATLKKIEGVTFWQTSLPSDFC